MNPIRSTLLAALCAAPPASASPQSIWYDISGSAGDAVGAALASAGDVDGDGFDDIVYGADHQLSGPGFVRVLCGQRGIPLAEFHGQISGDRFGSSAAGLEDLDGDALAEIAVGAHLATPPSGPAGAGLVRIFSTRTGNLLRELAGTGVGDHFGWSVGPCGDVDRDGVDDLIAGALDASTNQTRDGLIRVFSGSSGAVLHTIAGRTAFALFGWSVKGVGDLNGDQHADFAVGAPGLPQSQQTGSVAVFSGASGQVIHTWYGDGPEDGFGRSLAAPGDLNGDSIPDVLVGAPEPNTLDRGYVRAFSGADGSTLWTARGDAAADWFGAALDAAGDLDMDMVPDVMAGAPRNDMGGSMSGQVKFLSGRDGSALAVLGGTAVGQMYGMAVAGSFDANGDGKLDFAAGSATDDANGVDSGRVQVRSSSDLSLTCTTHVLSVAAGAPPLKLSLDAGPSHALMRFQMLGSITGTEPGSIVRSMRVPLLADRYTTMLMRGRLSRPIDGPRGQLDAQGKAVVDFILNPQVAAASVGRTFYHAFLVIDPLTGNVVHASNAWPLTIVP